MRHAINKLAGVLFCIGACAAAPVASALPISLLDTTFNPGAGYGIDSGRNAETPGNLLDVFFSASNASQSRQPPGLHEPIPFPLGTVELRELDIGPGVNIGISHQERDLLGVGATLRFKDELLHNLLSITITGTGKATAGTIDGDPDVDFLLEWDPATLDFGKGGLFDVRLEPISFAHRGSQVLTATLTPLSLPEEPPRRSPLGFVPSSAPEPATLALFALGLAAVAWLRGRDAAGGRPGAKLP